MIRKQKKISALLTAAALACGMISAMPAPSAAAAQQYQEILVLGDLISTRYQLTENEKSYYELLADATGANITNLATYGYTTTNLLAQLETTRAIEAVQKADAITISIGSNDLLAPARAYFNDLKEEDEGMMDTIKRLAEAGTATYHVGQLTAALREPRATAIENFAQIETRLRELNPDCDIIMLTLYNPIEADPDHFEEMTEQNQKDYNAFSKYVRNTEELLNKELRNLETVKIAEVGNTFNGQGWVFVRLDQNDFRPNAIGQAMIGTLVMDAVGISGTGDSEPIREVINEVSAAKYLSMTSKNVAQLEKYAAEAVVALGDYDNDSAISTADAQAVLDAYINAQIDKSILRNIRYDTFCRADVNSSRTLDSFDAQLILNYYVQNQAKLNPTWEDLLKKG